MSEIKIIPFAIVPWDHPELETIKTAYANAGAGLAIDFSTARPSGQAISMAEIEFRQAWFDRLGDRVLPFCRPSRFTFRTVK